MSFEKSFKSCFDKETCHKKCHPLKTEYDFVIAGGGTSASVLAKLLTDDLKTSVLVIEAGLNRDSDPNIDIPENKGVLTSSLVTVYDWPQLTLGQPKFNNATFSYLNGKMLGGSSNHNGMQYVRPTNNFLNLWSSLAGSDIWGPTNVNQAFTQLEMYVGSTNGPLDIRGTTGPVQIRQAPITPTVSAQQALTGITTVWNPSLGVPAVTQFNDYNDPTKPIGVALQWQLEEAINPPNTRQSGSIVFLDPIIKPSTITDEQGNIIHMYKGTNGRKLTILTEFFTNKVIFDKKTAIGLNVISKLGQSIDFFAKKEVLLSCGAFSCEVLMRSGIGNYSNPNAYTNPVQAPYTLLSNLDIPKVVDNPNVGQNSSNHIAFRIPMSSPSPLIPATDLNAIYATPAFAPDPRSGMSTTDRALEIFVSYTNLTTPNSLANNLLVVQVRPKSLGSVVLQSANPTSASLVDPNLWGNPDDQAMILAYYQSFNPAGNGIISPLNGPGYNWIIYLISQGWALTNTTLATFTNATSLTNYLITSVSFVYHYTATCRMLPKSQGGVVDPECRVYDVDGLRVIDNSVIPTVPDGNTGSEALVIGWIMGQRLISEYSGKCHKCGKH